MDVFRATLPYLRHGAMTLVALTGWLILLGIIFIPLERLFYLRPGKILRSQLLADIGYYFMNGVVPGVVLSLPLTAAAWAAHIIMPPGVTAIYAHWPVALRLFTALLVAEVGLYWGHRWCHEIPALWRFHVVHHSPTHVDWLVNSRGHPVDFIFTRLCGLSPLYALGLGNPIEGDPGVIPVLVMLIGPAWGFFIHANVRWRFGPLEWLIATPAFHHWHHANDGAAALNKNYAPLWPWMDRLFGTFHLPRDRQPLAYGTGDAVAPGMAAQLADPVTRTRTLALPPSPI
jgi:sterol desaturase/sphingolipid hydroxylase (fatty acid hydroxylase superfamily)